MKQLIALLAASALACSGAPAPPSPPTFSSQPSQTVISASGQLTLTIFEQADRPISRGVNALRLEVTSDAGADLSALSLSATTWMPVMGHGSATTPTVTPEGHGFSLSNVYLAMPGQWELRFDFAGSVTDHALARFDVD